MFKKIYLSIAISILVCSVTMAVSQADEDNNRARYESLYHDLDEIVIHIRDFTDEIQRGNETKLSREQIFSRNVLPDFYKERNYRPAWSQFDALEDAVTALKGSHQDGLLPGDYHKETLIDIMMQLEAKEGTGTTDHRLLAMFDILLTDGILLYAYHLMEGKIDPGTLNPDWNYENAKIPEDVAVALSYAIEHNIVTEELQLLRPQYPVYDLFLEEFC